MKTNGYFVKSIVALSLVGTFAMAEGNHENHNENDQNLKVQSSIQMKQNATEVDEQHSAKLGVAEVISAINYKFSGKITNVKLENIDGNLIYTAEVLGKNNAHTNIFVDAGNGKILASQVDKKDHADEQDNDQENSEG